MKNESQNEKEARVSAEIARIRAGKLDAGAMGRLGGLSRSQVKVQAAWRNGLLGGRPRKVKR